MLESRLISRLILAAASPTHPYLTRALPTPFADPECLNLLTLLDNTKSDFGQICGAMANGGLRDVPVYFQPKASCCKYAVPDGYPEKPLKGGELNLSALKHPDRCYLGAVDTDTAGVLRGTGSRAVGVVALADDLSEAEVVAEAEVSAIQGALFHRKDIGTEVRLAYRTHLLLQVPLKLAPRIVVCFASLRDSSPPV